MKDLRVFARELAPDAPPANQIDMWSAAGRMMYGGGSLAHPSTAVDVLDESSRALVVRLHNGGPPELRASGEDLRAIILRLEQTILADTALNELRLRPQISREIVRRGGRLDFQTLNDWIYAEVFRTPRRDPWLGLLQRDVFTGLPGDGVVVRAIR